MERILYIAVIMLVILGSVLESEAGRFRSSYFCTDSGRSCVDFGTKIVDGFTVSSVCWKYSYSKRCNYPSRNDCVSWERKGCEWVSDAECLLHDSLGKCVNQLKEFSCERWYSRTLENHTAGMGFEEKEGSKSLVCNGPACMDGNCFDKSYKTNGEIMDSLSKLNVASKMSPDKDANFNLFAGEAKHCSKKATGYHNCCRRDPNGWGKNIGAKCKEHERELMEDRNKNLCIYVGARKKKKAGVHTLTKHHYCCFSTMIDKVVQVQGRKQLGKNFGSGGSPNCRGLTLEEIQSLDFDKIDFSEFIEDLKLKFANNYKPPSSARLGNEIKNSVSSIEGFDTNPDIAGSRDSKSFDPNNPENSRMSGWNVHLDKDFAEDEDE